MQKKQKKQPYQFWSVARLTSLYCAGGRVHMICINPKTVADDRDEDDDSILNDFYVGPKVFDAPKPYCWVPA